MVSMRTFFTFFLTIVLLRGLIPAQSPAAVASPPPRREGVCLVLSGGGARGLAHIGILKLLDERGLRPACIVGASAGALVGALYCAGYSGKEIEELFRQVDYTEIIREQPDRRLLDYGEKQQPPVPSLTVELRDKTFQFPRGLIEGQLVLKMINNALTRRGAQDIHDFDRLPIPFRAVATDLRTGRSYVFRDGKLTTAIRASFAIPFLFTPVQLGGMVLVDGGVLNNLPVDVAKALGYRKIVAVNVAHPVAPEKKKLENFFQILDESFALARLEKDQRFQEMADLTLLPDVSDFSAGDFHRVTEIIGKGYETGGQWAEDLAAVFGPVIPPAQQPGPAPWKYDAPVDSVQVVGLANTRSGEVLEKSELHTGEPLSLSRIDRSIEKIYALDWFRTVDYDIGSSGGQFQFRYLVEEKPRKTLAVSLHYDNDYQFLGYGRYTNQRFLKTPLDAQLQLIAGGLKDYRATLSGTTRVVLPFRVAAETYFTEVPHDIRKDGDLLDSFSEKRTGVSLGGIVNLGNSVGLFGSFHLERVNIASLGLFDEQGREQLTFARVGAGFDTLDDWLFPTAGVRLEARLERGFKILSSNLQYTRVMGKGEFFQRLTPNNVIRVAGSNAYGWDLPHYFLFYAGGHNYLSQASVPAPGYRLDELYGKDLWTASGEFRRRFPWTGLGLVDASYLYVTYGVTGVRLPSIAGSNVDTHTPYRFFHGVGVGYALSTRIGPIRAFAGAGKGGRFTWALSLGPEF